MCVAPNADEDDQSREETNQEAEPHPAAGTAPRGSVTESQPHPAAINRTRGDGDFLGRF